MPPTRPIISGTGASQRCIPAQDGGAECSKVAEMAVCSRRCADKAHPLGQTRSPLMLEFGRCVRHPLTPWLHLGDIRLVFQGIGGCRCAQPVYESRNLYPCSSGVVPYHRIEAVGADPCTRCAAAQRVEEGSRAVLLIMAANAYRILLPSEPPRLPAFCTDSYGRKCHSGL